MPYKKVATISAGKTSQNKKKMLPKKRSASCPTTPVAISKLRTKAPNTRETRLEENIKRYREISNPLP